MAIDQSIALSVQDQATPNLNKVAAASRETAREIAALEGRLTAMNRTRASLRVDVTQARAELREAEKAYKSVATSAEDSAEAAKRLTEAGENYHNLVAELSSVDAQAKATQKSISNLYKGTRDGAAQLESTLTKGTTGGMSLSSFASLQGVQQLGNMLSGALSSVSTQLLSSALGSRQAGYVGDAITGAFSGAGAGAMIGSAIPGIGTAVGAIGGALLGAVTSGIKSAMAAAETKDDYFRGMVQDLYDTVTQQLAEDITSGAQIAASRETVGVSFATLLGGEENAQQLLGEITGFANATPYTYDQLAGAARIVASYGYEQNEIMRVLTAAGEASSAMGAGEQGMSTIATVLGRINSGKLDAEVMEMLTTIGVNGYQLIADRINRGGGNVDSTWVREGVSKGLFEDGAGDYGTARDFAQALIEELLGTYGGSLEAQSQTTEGLQSTLTGWTDQLNAAMGTGYNETRNEGLRAQIAYMEGNETELTEMYTLMGQWQAEQENAKEALQRDIETSLAAGELTGAALTMSEENQRLLQELIDQVSAGKASGDGAAITTAWQAAQAMAEAEFTNTDIYDKQIQQQQELAADIQREAAPSWYDAGQELSDQLSQGVLAGIRANRATIATEIAAVTADIAPGGAQSALAPGDTVQDMASQLRSMYTGHASGLNRVPYDNYAAMLHEGERVLTAREARAMDRPSPNVSVTVTGNTIRDSADEDRLAAKIAAAMQQALLLAPA